MVQKIHLQYYAATQSYTFLRVCGRRFVGRRLESVIMTIKLASLVFCDVDQGGSLNVFCFGGIAGFFFMVELVGTNRRIIISDFKIKYITNQNCSLSQATWSCCGGIFISCTRFYIERKHRNRKLGFQKQKGHTEIQCKLTLGIINSQQQQDCG